MNGETKKKIAMVAFILVAFFMQPSTSLAKQSNLVCSDGISNEQLAVVLNGMESVTLQLSQIGFKEEQIRELFALPSNPSYFYKESPTLFLEEPQFYLQEKALLTEETLHSGSGNPPQVTYLQKERIKTIFLVGKEYFQTSYYAGKKENGKDFGDYLKYLYISHYVDESRTLDLPYIITQDDRKEYEKFLRYSGEKELFEEIARFGEVFYEENNTAVLITRLGRMDKAIKEKSEGIKKEDALQIIEQIHPYILKNHGKAITEKELTESTYQYAKEKLVESKIKDSDIEKVIALEMAVMANKTIQMQGAIGAIPYFTKEYTGDLRIPAIMVLRYSYQSRMASRTGIYVGGGY